MKMMSKTDHVFCDCNLRAAADELESSIKRMRGKYGTSNAVSHLEYALENIKDCFSNKKFSKEYYQTFSNPPNTPKSRRLGWHEKGANDEQS